MPAVSGGGCGGVDLLAPLTSYRAGDRLCVSVLTSEAGICGHPDRPETEPGSHISQPPWGLSRAKGKEKEDSAWFGGLGSSLIVTAANCVLPTPGL